MRKSLLLYYQLLEIKYQAAGQQCSKLPIRQLFHPIAGPRRCCRAIGGLVALALVALVLHFIVATSLFKVDVSSSPSQ